jgi:hypothetical protein
MANCFQPLGARFTSAANGTEGSIEDVEANIILRSPFTPTPDFFLLTDPFGCGFAALCNMSGWRRVQKAHAYGWICDCECRLERF